MRKRILCRKICIIGAESTGTTTLAKALAEHYMTNWVPEYGRGYYEAKMYRHDANEWVTEEFIRIAKEQKKMENLLAKTANKVLICDTDPFATSIWHERDMGFRSPEVEKISENIKYDLYLLTNTDIPFVQDGTRDGEHIRQWMHETFIKRLSETNKKFAILSESHESRLSKALALINPIIYG